MRTGCCTGRTVFEDAEGRRTRLRDDALRQHGRPAHRARCGWRSRRRTTSARSPWRAASTATGATWNGCRSTRTAPPRRPRRAGRSGPSSKHLDESARSQSTDGVLYLEMRTIESGVTVGYAAATSSSLRRAAGRCGTAASGSSEMTGTAAARATTLRMDKLVAIYTSRDVRTAPRGRCRTAAEAALGEHRDTAGFDASVAAQQRGLGGAGGTTATCEVDGDPTLHPGGAVRHLPPADRRERRTTRRSTSGRSRCPARATGATCSGTPRSSCCRSSSTPSPTTARALLPTATTRWTGRAQNAREHGIRWGALRRGSRPTPASRSAPKFTPDGANRFWTREEEVHVIGRRRLRGDAVRRGHRRPCVPARARRGDPVRDQPVLGRRRGAWPERASAALHQVMGRTSSTRTSTTTPSPTTSCGGTCSRRRPTCTTSCAASIPDALAGGPRGSASPPGRWTAGGQVADADHAATAQPDNGVIEQFTGYFDRDDVPVTEWDENDMPRYPKGYHHFNCEDDEAAQAARRRDADLPAARRVRRGDQAGQLRVLRGADAAQVVAEPVHPRDHGHRGRRHHVAPYSTSPLGVRRPDRQPGQHRPRACTSPPPAAPGRCSSAGSAGCASSAGG